MGISNYVIAYITGFLHLANNSIFSGTSEVSVETPDDQENSVMELIVTNTGDQPIDVTIKIIFDDDSVLEIPVSYLL